jgi:hypothetical protein
MKSVSSTRVFSPESVWSPSIDQEIEIRDQCFFGTSPENKKSALNCTITKMRVFGATDAAIKLVESYEGDWFLREFQELGAVDLAVLSGFALNSPELSYWEVLVNGDPEILEPSEQIQKIDITHHPNYSKIKKRFSKAEIWTRYSFQSKQVGGDGSIRYIFSFGLLNGCHACEPAGTARFAYEFDKSGKYKNVTLIDLKPDSKP